MEEEWVEYDGGGVQDWHQNARRIRVAPGVAVIPERAFQDCEDLREVDLSNVTIISRHAFWNCVSLRVVDLGNVTTISAYAFLDCRSLERVIWTTASAVEICDGAFYGCKSLTAINLSDVTKIGAGAFWNCEALTSVAISASVASIEDCAFDQFLFDECEALTHAIVIPSSVAVIGESAFRDCTNLAEVDLGEGIHCIEGEAFRNCSALVRIAVPASVTDIGEYAFRGCISLGEVELNEGLQHIGKGAFEDCKSLQSISIPSTALKIGDFAFAHCDQLMHVELQEGLEKIGVQAFNGCQALERITIPSSTSLIGVSAFWNCHNLSEVTLREGVHCIGGRAFSHCPYLDHINIPPLAFLIDTDRSSCQLTRTTMPKPRDGKLVVSKWMQYRSRSQLLQAEAKLNEILGRRQQAEERIKCIREWFAYFFLLDVTTLLELAIWRAKMDGNEQDAEARQDRRRNCGSDMNVIIPDVLKFLEV